MAAPYIPAWKWVKVEEMIADGCPNSEIARTLHMSPLRISKRYPGSQTPAEQRGQLSAFARKLNALPDVLPGRPAPAPKQPGAQLSSEPRWWQE